MGTTRVIFSPLISVSMPWSRLPRDCSVWMVSSKLEPCGLSVGWNVGLTVAILDVENRATRLSERRCR